jgi:hypothetical protein
LDNTKHITSFENPEGRWVVSKTKVDQRETEEEEEEMIFSSLGHV